MVASIKFEGWLVGLPLAVLIFAGGCVVDIAGYALCNRLFPPPPPPSIWTPRRPLRWWEREVKREFWFQLLAVLTVIAILGLVSELHR